MKLCLLTAHQKYPKQILSKWHGNAWKKCGLSTTHILIWTRNPGFASHSCREGILMTDWFFVLH